MVLYELVKLMIQILIYKCNDAVTNDFCSNYIQYCISTHWQEGANKINKTKTHKIYQ